MFCQVITLPIANHACFLCSNTKFTIASLSNSCMFCQVITLPLMLPLKQHKVYHGLSHLYSCMYPWVFCPAHPTILQTTHAHFTRFTIASPPTHVLFISPNPLNTTCASCAWHASYSLVCPHAQDSSGSILDLPMSQPGPAALLGPEAPKPEPAKLTRDLQVLRFAADFKKPCLVLKAKEGACRTALFPHHQSEL